MPQKLRSPAPPPGVSEPVRAPDTGVSESGYDKSQPRPSPDRYPPSDDKDDDQREKSVKKDSTHNTDSNIQSSSCRILNTKHQDQSDSGKRQSIKKKVSLTFGRSKDVNVKGSTACCVM